MNTTEVIVSIAAGLAINEFCDISPWAARKVVIWSARVRYGKSQRADIRAEELAAVIDSRPGKLFKLLTALAFASGATSARAHQTLLLLQLYLNTINGSRTRHRIVQITLAQSEATLIDEVAPDSVMEEQLQVVLTTKTLSHGVDLKHLEAVHLPSAPMNNMLQLPGRVNRLFNG